MRAVPLCPHAVSGQPNSCTCSRAEGQAAPGGGGYAPKVMLKAWKLLRLVLAAGLFGWSLMVIVPAPRLPLFYLALGATEFGHWFAGASLLVALAETRRFGRSRPALVMGLAAALLFVSSAVRASWLARGLPGEYARAYASLGAGPMRGDDVPFAWGRLWVGGGGRLERPETLEYAIHEGQGLRMDFYRAAAATPAPCVVVIHGGGWDSGERGEFPEFNRHLALRGYAVAAVDYRLAPAHPWPAQGEDVGAALAYLQEHAGALGIDSERLVLMGRSAGGQIALAVAYGGKFPSIRGCIAFYAPADLNFAYAYADPGDILNSLGLLKGYLGGTPSEAGANYDDASPILRVGARTVPTLLLHGRRDELVWCRQSERLAARLRGAGVPHLFITLPWATHAFDYNIQGPGGQIAAWSVGQFIEAVAGGKRSPGALPQAAP